MRAAEGGKEVVEGIFVGDVDGRELQADFALVSVEQVVVSHRHVEEVARRDARRVVIVVFGIWLRHLNQTGAKLRCQACPSRNGSGGRGADTVATEAGLKLLIGAQRIAEGIL